MPTTKRRRKAAKAVMKAAGKTKTQKSLDDWTSQNWQYSDGKQTKKKKKGRYLPKSAWASLTPAQKAATNKKKREGTKKGKSNVAYSKPVAQAVKSA